MVDSPDAESMAAHPVSCRRTASGRRAATIVARAVEPRPRDDATAVLLAQLSRSTYDGYLRTITGPPTRHSLSTEFRDVMDAAAEALTGFGYRVTQIPVPVGAGSTVNLAAEKPGDPAGPRRLILVTAHLDSVNQSGADMPAPGADDNATGSAGVLELGRVLGMGNWANDLRLVLFGGEEQGLLGSVRYVAEMTDQDRLRTSAVINMDMIGRRNTSLPGVMIEGAEVSRTLVDELVNAAATWTGLDVTTSLDPFASDHVPFIEAGLPAVLTIEADDRANLDVHTERDTSDLLDPDLAMDILRMNLAVIVHYLDNG
jgi:Zn-dependent M28 family amino/carboxypeptidase